MLIVMFIVICAFSFIARLIMYTKNQENLVTLTSLVASNCIGILIMIIQMFINLIKEASNIECYISLVLLTLLLVFDVYEMIKLSVEQDELQE